MKVLDEYILMVLFVLLLKRVHFLANETQRCDYSNESSPWVHSNGTVCVITEVSSFWQYSVGFSWTHLALWLTFIILTAENLAVYAIITWSSVPDPPSIFSLRGLPGLCSCALKLDTSSRNRAISSESWRFCGRDNNGKGFRLLHVQKPLGSWFNSNSSGLCLNRTNEKDSRVRLRTNFLPITCCAIKGKEIV